MLILNNIKTFNPFMRKNIMPKQLFIITLIFLSACTEQQTVSPADFSNMSITLDGKAGYQKIVREAVNALKKAEQVGGEWRDSTKIMKEAKELAGSNNYIEAIKKIKTTRFQAKRGYRQIMAQKNKGNPDYLTQ